MSPRILKIFLLSALLFSISVSAGAQIPQPLRSLLDKPYMQGCSFALDVQEVETGKIVYSYEADRQLTPASVMKTVTTATALEVLGPAYRFSTTLAYDGEIRDGVLEGNLYVRGSGDPTLGSVHFAADKNTYTPDRNTFMPEWIAALRKAGVRQIRGAVIADESIFDTEGISMKWMREDMGSYYGAGSYGLCVFDNLYRLYLRSGKAGSRPEILRTEPELPDIRFHNYLWARQVRSDSAYIVGAPFAPDRYLYGVLPVNRASYILKGDIPDPALFLAQYVTRQLKKAGIQVEDSAACYRILKEEGRWKQQAKKEICTTYSPTLEKIAEVTNHVSHNLFADALLKATGASAGRAAEGKTYFNPGEEGASSFEQGIRLVHAYWKEKRLDTSSLWMYDGSGLAVTDKVSARFLTDLLAYMATRSSVSEAFVGSLPEVGQEGSVRHFLKGSRLQGKVRLKSGSMSRVKGYAGYITSDGKQYAIALLVNNYACDGRVLNKALEELLLKLF